MDIETVIRDFATAGSNTLPREALQWALDNWPEAAPRFLEILNRFVEAEDDSEETASILFFAVHLLAEKAEPAAFGPLCRLLHDNELADEVLGDGITSTLSGLLIGLY